MTSIINLQTLQDLQSYLDKFSNELKKENIYLSKNSEQNLFSRTLGYKNYSELKKAISGGNEEYLFTCEKINDRIFIEIECEKLTPHIISTLIRNHIKQDRKSVIFYGSNSEVLDQVFDNFKNEFQIYSKQSKPINIKCSIDQLSDNKEISDLIQKSDSERLFFIYDDEADFLVKSVFSNPIKEENQKYNVLKLLDNIKYCIHLKLTEK